jgi:putative adhesin
VLVVGAAAVLLVLDLASRQERIVSYEVAGALNGVTLDVDDADVDIVRGGGRRAIDVRRTDRYAFGHSARFERTIAGGTVRLRSRCPQTVTHTCAVSYRIVVPDNLPVDVRTGAGTVRLSDYHGSARVSTGSGDIDVGGFCGFSLNARTASGDVSATASCAPQQLSLRSRTGSVHAVVPPGRYQVDAESASGSREVRGLSAVADAPFSIQALSSSGDVQVEGGQ